MSDIDYSYALSRLRSEIEDLVQNSLRYLPRHLIKGYWEVRYYFEWLYDDWHVARIDKEVVKLGSAKLVAEALVSEYGFSWVESSNIHLAIQHEEIWPEPISLDSIDSGDWTNSLGTNWLRNSRRRFDKSVPFKVGEVTFEFYFYVRSELAWRLRHKEAEDIRPLLPEERHEIDRVLTAFQEKWSVAITNSPTKDGSIPDFSGTPLDIAELQWLRYEGCDSFVDLKQLGLVHDYIVGLVLSSLPGIDLLMVKLSDRWQLALRGLPEKELITTVADYRDARWFHKRAASWLDGSIDEPYEEGYSLLYFEFIQDSILQQGDLWSQTSKNTFIDLFNTLQNL